MKKAMIKTTMALLVVVVGLGATTAQAQVCDEDPTQEALQYLRRLSLDLRGHPPTTAELETVVTAREVPAELVADMVYSEEFITTMRHYHRELLWANVANQRMAVNDFELNPPGPESAGYWLRSAGRSIAWRGVQEGCLDEPARFDADGVPLTEPDPLRPGVQKEGWVELSPYWAPDTTVRVCAFEAQAITDLPDFELPAEFSALGNDMDCVVNANDRRCGCGPSLSLCQAPTGPGESTNVTLNLSLNEQILRFVDRILREDRPYTDIIEGAGIEVNGPIAHWAKWQSLTGGNQVITLPWRNYEIPADLDFDDVDRWIEVERGERHAGVLTLPAYLLKFQSNRGRANRFYNAFLCQHFEAPPGGLPPASDSCNDEPDLTERCGCKHCHIAVEPAAAHWGRWTQAGVGALNDDIFPTENPLCATVGSNNQLCRLFYMTPQKVVHDKERDYLGMFEPYVFADDTIRKNIDDGPAALASKAIEDGAFASCTTRKLWSWFMAREPVDGDEEFLGPLEDEFSSDYDFRSLVHAIVTHPQYQLGQRYED